MAPSILQSGSVTSPAPLIQRNNRNSLFRISSIPSYSILVAATEIPHLTNCKYSENNDIDIDDERIFLEKKVHPSQEDVRMFEKIAEKLGSPAFEAFLNQRVSLTTEQMNKIEIARLQANVEKLPPRYPSQDSYLRKDIHNLYFTSLHTSLNRLENPSFQQQRYCMSNEKEETLYAQRIFKRVSRALKLRMVSQDADLISSEQKKEIRFKEVEENLNQLVDRFPRFDNQRVVFRNATSVDVK
ncbi:17281_t:CDS:2 [Acaulospora morrowiae]|uniref:17281_t:CDS:1 n=1 Tax=Acaulospora morrowiae TaxID=94023 RepID=A0A9N9D4G2_9GLOM|nr:17281_t:CDS:2 [Acaulospora morrowiae]